MLKLFHSEEYVQNLVDTDQIIHQKLAARGIAEDRKAKSTNQSVQPSSASIRGPIAYEESVEHNIMTQGTMDAILHTVECGKIALDKMFNKKSALR
jgi:hypothetical protein